MNKATYLPIEVIRAAKVLTDYLGDIGCTDIQVSYLGGIKLLKSNGEVEYISPVASDMMLMSQQEEKDDPRR